MRKKEFLVLLILVSITVSGCKSTPKTETKIEKKNAVEAVNEFGRINNRTGRRL